MLTKIPLVGGIDEILAVQIFNNKFTAIHWSWGKESGVYINLNPVTSLTDIDGALGEAIEKANYTGSLITILYSGPKIETVFLTSPPLNDADLAKYVMRQAEKEKSFDDELVFTYSVTASPKKNNIICTSILPKQFFDSLVNICLGNELYLQKLIAPSAVVSQIVKNSDRDSKEALGVIADLGGSLYLYICQSNGDVVFSRMLNLEHQVETNYQRLGEEISRSLLFVKQQHGIATGELLFMGTFPNELIEKIGDQVDLPAKFEVELTSYDCLREVHNISSSSEVNFVPKDVRNFATRRAYAKYMIAILVLAWVTAFSIVFTIEYQIRTSNFNLLLNSSELQRIKEYHSTLEAEIASKRELESTVIELSGYVPIKALFIGYLSHSLPFELTLVNLEMQEADDQIRVKLSGISQASQERSIETLSQFETNLIQGPYHFNVTESWQNNWLKSVSNESEISDAKKFDFTINGFIKK